MRDNTVEAFLALVRAGLWETEARLESFGKVDYEAVLRIAREQFVVGIVAAGLEHVTDVRVPKIWALRFAAETMQLELRNFGMNSFIAELVAKMSRDRIYVLLVKGQGLSQCYERPLWRTCGDIDLLLSEPYYSKAKELLSPSAYKIETEYEYSQHLGMTIDGWEVELHGSLRGGLWKRLDRALDNIQKEAFNRGKVRSWMNGNTNVLLLGEDEDVIYVFAHLLQHFFKGNTSLRQICDWCRLLWTYRTSIDHKLLWKRIEQMGVKTEWNTFMSLAINNLGLPPEAVPFFLNDEKWHKKGNRAIMKILETRNMVSSSNMHSRDTMSYIERKICSFWTHTRHGIRSFTLFPLDSIKVWCRMLIWGIKDIMTI